MGGTPCGNMEDYKECMAHPGTGLRILFESCPASTWPSQKTPAQVYHLAPTVLFAVL